MRFSLPSVSRNGYMGVFNVPAYRETQPQLVIELRRARRYEYHLGVVILGFDSPVPGGGEQANGRAPADRASIVPTAYALLGAYLRNTLRETDILTCIPEWLAFAAFLPGIDRRSTEQAMGRLRDGFHGCAGFDLRGGAAAFPDDGLTLEDVLGSACMAWRATARRNAALLPEA